MSCQIDNKGLIRLKADVVDAIRGVMKKTGAMESYYNKITGGTGACLVPETKITVEDGGFKPIEDIQEGDLVLTHKGRLRRVTKIMKREVHEDILGIKITGMPDVLEVTKEHPLYIRKMIPQKKPTSHARIEYAELPEWIKAKEVNRNDVIHAPTYNPGNTSEEIDEETAFVLGIYCAEGFLSGVENPQKEWKTGQYYEVVPNWCLKKKPNNGFCVHFVLHKEKDKNLTSALKKYAKRLKIAVKTRSCVSSDKTVNITLNHRPFAKLCKKHVGEGARNKRLSKSLMTATVSIQKSFLAGYLFGDGYTSCTKMRSGKIFKRIVSSTSSEQLCHQLFWLMERCGIISTARHTKVCGGPQYREREFDQWKTSICQTQAKKMAALLNEDFDRKQVRGGRFASAACTYSKITSVVPRNYRGTVYNFEVEEDNSYVANGCTVHNCEQAPTAFILQNTPEISFLSQTDQLSMEADIIEDDIKAIWTLGRSYRNEPKAGDGRHLSEFALLEYECTDMDLAGLLKFQQELLNECIEVGLKSDIISDEHKVRLKRYADNHATVISYTDVLKKLNNGGMSINWGDDFSSEVEEAICVLFEGPVQVTHYPESIKFFNMYRTDRDPLEADMSIEEYNQNRYTVDCCDVLLPFGGETFGGSRREENFSTIKMKLEESTMFKQMISIRDKQLKMRGETLQPDEVAKAAFEPFSPYINLFNPDKHPERKNLTRSGFGLGMGRITQFLLGRTFIIPF